MRPVKLAAAAAMSLLTPLAFAADTPGQKFRVNFDDLPKPGATQSASNPSRTIARNGAMPQVPAGFQVNVFAEGLANARWLAVAPNGDVFLAEPEAGRITLLRDANKDGVAEGRTTFVSGLASVHGLAIQGGNLYASTPTIVYRMPYKDGDTQASASQTAITARGALGDGAGHFTRNLAISPDGRSLMVAIGSRTNIAEEPAPRAAVTRFDIAGTNPVTFASGLRNPVGIAYKPGTNDLYVVVNERDGYGDGLVPDYFTRIQENDFYGWPYAYLGPHPSQGAIGAAKPDMVAKTKAPDVLFEAHSAPLGLAFYDGQAFPAEYRGNAFVALHGSWNSGKPTGYKVVMVPFQNGRPTGEYINFATGWWAGGTARAEVWGRPVGIAVAADGSLLVADDEANVVWRISYKG